MARKTSQLQIRVTPAQKDALKRLARRAGLDISAYVLERALPRDDLRLAGILRVLERDEDSRYGLAEMHDLLAGLPPIEFDVALRVADLRRLSPLLQNYVAAMVEQAAQLKQVSPPAWTREVLPLAEPYFATDLRSLRPYLLVASPAVFKRRNLFVDSAVGRRV